MESKKRKLSEEGLEEIGKIEQEALKAKKRLLPKKADFRMRAHVNVLKDTPWPYPLNPDYVDWSIHFPKFFGGSDEENQALPLNTEEHEIFYDNKNPIDGTKNGKKGPCVEFVDVGCGYGGLLFALSKSFPNVLSLGIEIRDKLVNYVGEKVRALRIENPGEYNNIAVFRTNAMRHLVNYFRKGQLSKMFFCFPDPNFKKKNFRRRIINIGYLSEYAYFLKPGGMIYCITDVEELHKWHEEHLSANKLFQRVDDKEVESDVCIKLIWNETEEGKKVERNNGKKFFCVYRRI